MSSDIEIAQKARLERIPQIAEKLGIPEEQLEPYGHNKAKITLDYLASLEDRPQGKLILVTAMTPTPAGEGKTTTTVGLGDALNLLGKKAAICLREPSLGPVFGMKGGAAGGRAAHHVAPGHGHERPGVARDHGRPRRPWQWIPPPGRLRHHRGLRD